MAPHSPNKPTRALELGDQKYTIAVDFNFYRTVHKETGLDLLSGTGKDFKPNPEELTVMVYAALRSGGSELAVDDVGGLLHPGNAVYVLTELLALMQESSPSSNGAAPLAATETASEGAPIG